MLQVDEGYVFFETSTGFDLKDVCYVEYRANHVIDLEKAIKICSIRKYYEGHGFRKFVCYIREGVSFSKDATMHFGRYEEVMNIHYMAVCDKEMGFISRYILNFIYRTKKNPTTRYFKTILEAKDWIVKQKK